MEYLDLDINKINVGDMFYVEIKNLLGIRVLTKNKENNFSLSLEQFDMFSNDGMILIDEEIRKSKLLGDYVDSQIDTINEIKNAITIVQYLGNGEFCESFTGIDIGYQSFQTNPLLLSSRKFVEGFNEYSKMPLIVKNGKLMPMNILNQIRYYTQLENMQFEKTNRGSVDLKIQSAIYAMYNISFNKLKVIRDEIISQDEKNVTRTLKKDSFDTALEGSKIFLEAQGFINKK